MIQQRHWQSGMLPAHSLTPSHVAKSSSLHVIGDTYLDLFACGGCGYRLSLVTETPTPYVALERERDREREILRMSGACDGVSV